MDPIIATSIDTIPVSQTGTVTSDPINIGGKATPVFEINPTDFTNPSQSMIVRIQISKDSGRTWIDKLVCDVPDMPEGGLAPYSVTDSLINFQTGEKFPIAYDQGVLTRCVIEVTGNITFGIKGSVK